MIIIIRRIVVVVILQLNNIDVYIYIYRERERCILLGFFQRVHRDEAVGRAAGHIGAWTNK